MRIDAKQAMVDAAEALMAERGIAAVSLREVQAAAGQRNKSAAAYHFGTREGLVRAILEARMARVMERRMALLAQLDEEGRGEDLRSLVEAFIEPIYDMSLAQPNSSYARFLAQAYRNDIVIPLLEERGIQEGFREWRRRVEPHLVQLPTPVRQLRIDQFASMVIHTLAYWEAGRGEEDVPVSARLEDLIDSCVAVLEAPSSDATRAMLRAAGRASTVA